MRKATIITGIVLVAACMFLMTLAFAQTTTATTDQGRLVANRAFVIDFGQYAAKMQAQIDKNNKLMEERNKSAAAQKRGLPTEEFKMEFSDWSLDKWEVELNSSAANILNNVLSYITNVKSDYWKKYYNQYYKGQRIGGYDEKSTEDVLGARIHFPTHRQNCWAKIHPPFELNAYDEKGDLANENNGIVDNVGQIKSVSVWVKGRNYENGFAVRLKDREGIEREYFFGNLLFDNWRELTWVNPNYIENPKDRVIARLPLYPRSRPYIKFTAFVIYRQMDSVGGDFVIYVRDLKLAYDKAIPDDEETDINDEKVWGILSKARLEEKDREMLKLAERKVLLKQEEAKLRNTKATTTTGP